jgi:hypothetical protein
VKCQAATIATSGSPASLVLSLCILAVFVSACGRQVFVYPAVGGGPLCAPGRDLGTVAVLPEVAWRLDQKEPDQRKEMARAVLSRVFAQLPCGVVAPPGGLRDFHAWSAGRESDILAALAREGVDTAIFIRLEELTPRLVFTFSVPFLWLSSTEADFRIRALSTGEPRVWIDERIRHTSGGAFQVRRASWAGEDLELGLWRALATAPGRS